MGERTLEILPATRRRKRALCAVAGPTAPRTTATAPRVGARIWALSSALATGHITLR
jgi:hypothetical protein